MSIIPRKPLKAKKKLTVPKKTEVGERFAYLNKNLVNNPGPLVNWSGPKLLALFTSMAEAQRQDTPYLPLGTDYGFLRSLNISRPSADDYIFLSAFLQQGQDTSLDIKKWYMARKVTHTDEETVEAYAETHVVNRRQAREALEQQRKERNYERRHFPYLWRVRRHLDGRRTLGFDRQYFAVNQRDRKNKKKRQEPWVPVYLDAVHMLKYRRRIWLMLLIQAYADKPGRYLKRDLVGLAEHIGMHELNVTRLKQRLAKATAAIGKALGWKLDIKIIDDVVTIRHLKAADEGLGLGRKRLYSYDLDLVELAKDWRDYTKTRRDQLWHELDEAERHQMRAIWQILNSTSASRVKA